MGLLWLTRWAPYAPLKGGDIDYSRELMHSVAARTPVHGLVFSAPGVEPPPHPGLSWTQLPAHEPPRLLSLLSPLPAVAFRHQDKSYLAEAVRLAEAERPQALLVDFIGLFGLVAPLRTALVRRMGVARPRVLVVDHNFEHNIRQQMAANELRPHMHAALVYDAWKAGRVERLANGAADALVANTDADKALFAQVVDTPGVTVTPAYSGRKLPPRLIGPETPRRICILGGHEAHHKKMVLELTLAALQRRGVERECEVDVIGPGDSTFFTRKYPGVRFQGFVDDVASYLKTVRFGLIPDEIGGGFKHRALMHAFHRTPMLALNKALAGMNFKPGEDYVGVDTLDEMAAVIPGLLDDFETLNHVQASAFELCEGSYDWADRGRLLFDYIAAMARPNA